MLGNNKKTAIDASYQVSLHLAEGFQRRRLKCEKLTDDIRRTTDDGRWTPSDGKSSHCLWQRELKTHKLKIYPLKTKKMKILLISDARFMTVTYLLQCNPKLLVKIHFCEMNTYYHKY
jgi:hypothetical protein